uniref:Uncharacterized LOC103187865 n=1 Tax=Callorhinchus milii TaxID=7868 RepID=A0A4W3J0S1_CALMI
MAGILKPDTVSDTEDRKALKAEVEQRKEDVRDFVTLFPGWRVWMISYIRDLQKIADDIYSIHKPVTSVGVGQSVAGGAANTAACDMDIVTQTQRQKRVNDIMEQYTKDSRKMAECYTKLLRAVQFLKHCEKSETAFPGGAESLTEPLAGFVAVDETITKQETVTSKAGSAAQTRLPFMSSLIPRANDGHNLNCGARADIAKHIEDVAKVLEDEVTAYEEVYKHLEGTVTTTTNYICTVPFPSGTASMYCTQDSGAAAEAGSSDIIFRVGPGRYQNCLCLTKTNNNLVMCVRGRDQGWHSVCQREGIAPPHLWPSLSPPPACSLQLYHCSFASRAYNSTSPYMVENDSV